MSVHLLTSTDSQYMDHSVSVCIVILTETIEPEYVHTYSTVYMCMYMCMYVCMHICIIVYYTYICMHVCRYILYVLYVRMYHGMYMSNMHAMSNNWRIGGVVCILGDGSGETINSSE